MWGLQHVKEVDVILSDTIAGSMWGSFMYTLRKTNKTHEDHIKQSFIEEVLYPGSRPSPLVRPPHILGDPIPRCCNSTHLLPTFGLSLACLSLPWQAEKQLWASTTHQARRWNFLSFVDIIMYVERSDSRNISYRLLRCLLFPLAELEPAVPVKSTWSTRLLGMWAALIFMLPALFGR